MKRSFWGAHRPPQLWYQMDREADQIPVLLRAETSGVLLTVRSENNRVLAARSTHDGHPELKLVDLLEQAPERGEYRVELARNRTRKARTARLSVSFLDVSLRLRAQWSHRFVADASITVVHVRGNRPARG